MFEVITEWDVPGGGGGLNVMYASGLGDIVLFRETWSEALASVADRFSTATSWRIRTEGRIINPVNGEATGDWNDPTAYIGQGSGAGTVVPNAAQVLLQWQTGDRVNGRSIRGRTFLPGLDPINVFQGNLSQTAQADFVAGANLLVQFGSLVIWHRPSPDGESPGSEHLVRGASCWGELATQRRRRT